MHIFNFTYHVKAHNFQVSTNLSPELQACPTGLKGSSSITWTKINSLALPPRPPAQTWPPFKLSALENAPVFLWPPDAKSLRWPDLAPLEHQHLHPCRDLLALPSDYLSNAFLYSPSPHSSPVHNQLFPAKYSAGSLCFHFTVFQPQRKGCSISRSPNSSLLVTYKPGVIFLNP